MRRAAAGAALWLCLAAGCGAEDEADRGGVYETALDTCGVSTVEQLAEEFGGSADRPRSVAAAYAADTTGGEDEAAAREGCLEGLRRDP